jgi:hypothetical protein
MEREAERRRVDANEKLGERVLKILLMEREAERDVDAQ